MLVLQIGVFKLKELISLVWLWEIKLQEFINVTVKLKNWINIFTEKLSIKRWGLTAKHDKSLVSEIKYITIGDSVMFFFWTFKCRKQWRLVRVGSVSLMRVYSVSWVFMSVDCHYVESWVSVFFCLKSLPIAHCIPLTSCIIAARWFATVKKWPLQNTNSSLLIWHE